MANVIWIPHAQEAWTPAVVESSQGNSITVKLKINNSVVQIPGPASNYEPLELASLDEVCDNFCLLYTSDAADE